nr:truncated Tef [Drosophila melanogaster]
MSKFLDMLSGS